MPTQVGIHVFPAVISKDVDGGPPPAMTITTNRRVNDFGGWYDIAPAEPAGSIALPTVAAGFT